MPSGSSMVYVKHTIASANTLKIHNILIFVGPSNLVRMMNEHSNEHICRIGFSNSAICMYESVNVNTSIISFH